MSKLTDRWIEPRDIALLELCLERDPHHVGTKVEFFFRPGTVTKVYEDEDGPVLFLRGEGIESKEGKILRLDIQYVNNDDHKRNMAAMLGGFDRLANKSKERGFTEIFFNSNSPLLKKFCIKRFGFVESNGELRKYL